eukprot:TRINITY_DN79_c0_g2_i9.p1 TRINITY_DN79_c0_g2~~TRINITY_DN79_c0_g2_i9.p1  ORF type:complete len:264 (+),score=19.40 TRINITY_DN79_c0_g2_i9:61-852(+)
MTKYVLERHATEKKFRTTYVSGVRSGTHMLSLQTIFGQFLGDATRSGATVWNTIYTLFSPTKALEYALTTPLQVKRVFILSAVLVPLFLLLILREEGLHSFVEILLSSYRNQDLTILMESIFFGPSLMSWSFEFLVMLIWSIPIFPTIIFVDHNWLQGIFEYMLITFLLFKGLARTFSLLSLVMFFPNVSERLIGHILPHFQFKGALANLFMTLVGSTWIRMYPRKEHEKKKKREGEKISTCRAIHLRFRSFLTFPSRLLVFM